MAPIMLLAAADRGRQPLGMAEVVSAKVVPSR
jgi:hypothetical protein